MGAPWGKNSARGPGCEQAEFCDLCGNLVDAADLVESDVQGLRSARICRRHGQHVNNPSFEDYGGANQSGPKDSFEFPHGGTDWYPGSGS